MAMKFQTENTAFPLRAGFASAAVHEIAVADFNGDGKLDIALSYFLYPLEDRAVPIRLLTGDGAGGFTDATNALFADQSPVTAHGRQIVIADFNMDGRADAFFADHGYDASPFPGARNALMLSSGPTGLSNATTRLPTLTDFSHSATAGDIDGDGDIDLYVGNYGGGTEEASYFLINDGTANFKLSRAGLPADVAGGSYNSPASLLFDADGDDDLDLLLTPNETQTQDARLLKNDGKGNFHTQSSFAMPKNGSSETVIDAKAVDLNGDGKLDLVMTTVVDLFKPGTTQIWINDGQGGFANETSTRLPIQLTEDWYTRTQLVDLNGDGHIDLLASNNHKQAVFLNDGAGRFIQLPEGWLNISQYDRLQAADINGDGRMDVIAWRGVWDGAEHFTNHMSVDEGMTVSGSTLADALVGGARAESLSGQDGDDVIFGGAGDDTLSGGDDADILVGGAGADSIDGGRGLDEARFSGAKADYTITRNADGSYTVSNKTSDRDGIDTVRNVEQLRFMDQTFATEPLFPDLFAANLSQGKAIAAGYQILLGGTPGIAGFEFLIKGNLSTNFGAGAGPVFNDENIFINVVNSLVQGNPIASAQFNSLASGITLAEQVASLYAKIIPVAKQTAEGVAYLTRPDGLKFYQDVAKERGITAENGPAVVALASLLKVAVDGKVGIGNPVSDLIASLADGSSEVPATSQVVLPIETIDGTKFDADDAPDVMPGFSGPAPVPMEIIGMGFDYLDLAAA